MHREAQAVLDLLGLRIDVPSDKVVTVGGWWQSKYSLPNVPMVEAVQMLARSEACCSIRSIPARRWPA